MSEFKVIYDPSTTNIAFEHQDNQGNSIGFYNNLKDVLKMNKPIAFEIGKFPELKIAEEHMLEYKKSYIHMINELVFKNGAISKDAFEKTEKLIDQLKK